jgi:oxygen-independent coproporphyrinogen-3 oxidase
MTVLLYIHVPFCRRRCLYCAFASLPLEGGAGRREVSAYLETLLREMALWGDRLGRARVETLFFGGGTPSLLPPEALEGIVHRARGCFALDAAAEITLEANPESALAPGWLHGLRKTGVNRLSLGVQSLEDDVLRMLGRAHTVREAACACELARDAGITNLSLDLIWGLPGRGIGQSQAQWLRQLKQAAELKPDHISAYGLTLEEGTPLAEACADGRLSLPGEREQASLYLAGADFLESLGFMQYEISNFARMGYACRHNLGYWEGCEFLGLGPSAASTLAGRRWTNPADPAAWREAVRNGSVGAAFEELDLPTRLKELLMLRLRLNKGLRFQEWKALTGRSFLRDYAGLVEPLQRNGLAATRQGTFRLTRSGMLVSNAILAHFFARLEEFRPNSDSSA